MSIILHIETATKNCSVALSKAGKILALVEKYSENYSHSEQLHLFIEKVLEKADLKISSISAIAVSKGPGSFTGLRIGVAAAKGICYALNLPLIAINSLEILAGKVKNIDDGFIFPMLDARRMEVYTMVLNHKKEVIKPTFAEVISESSFKSFSKEKKWIFIGAGINKCKKIIKSPNIDFKENLNFPSSREMVPLAWKAFIEKKFENIAYFEPFYLKEFYNNLR